MLEPTLMRSPHPLLLLLLIAMTPLRASASPHGVVPSHYKEIHVKPSTFAAKGGVLGRTITVWLSPVLAKDPAHAQKLLRERGRLLVLHDNQIMWDGHDAPHGGIRINHTAEAMVRRGELPPLIVVGIPNAGPGRIAEFAGRIAGDPRRQKAYEHYVVHDVLPAVRAALPYAPGADKTYSAGVSYGADAALSVVLRHPDKFAGAAVLSGYRKFGPHTSTVEPIAKLLASKPPAKRPRLLIGTGLADHHERDHQGELGKLVKLLVGAGYNVTEHPQHYRATSSDKTLHVFTDPPAQHNELSWRAQMGQWVLPFVGQNL
ncbi:MAG: hypothetical protein KC503_27425 [Myxococcales bacterium]|nr:hypothetical protein [Myxococcales bacterium]